MMTAALALWACVAAVPAQAQTEAHIVAFHGAGHAVSMPLLEAWEGFLRAEKAGIIFAENIRARANGHSYEFSPGGPPVDATAEALETPDGSFVLLPPDPKRLERFEAYARRPDVYSDRRAPRLSRRTVRMVPSAGRQLVVLPEESQGAERVWSDQLALVYALEGGTRGVFLYKTRGGLGRVAAAIEELRRVWGKDILVLSRGDSFDRTEPPGVEPFRALERAGVRASAVGAGELARLNDIARYRVQAGTESAVAFLAANVFSQKPDSPLERWRVFRAGQLRVGVVGLTREGAETALTPENAGRFSISSPEAAAREAVQSLRREADVVVALTDLTPAQNASLRQNVPGLDLIMSDGLSASEGAPQTSAAESAERGPGDPALLIASDSPGTLSFVTARRTPAAGGRFGLALREEHRRADEDARELPGFPGFPFESYGVDVGSAPALLPPARALSPEASAPRLKDADFWRLAASLAAEATGAEAAFLPVVPVDNRTTGAVPEEVVRTWFGVPDRVTVVQLSADGVRTLLEQARRGVLAAGGFGPGDTLHGLPLDYRSSYRVAVASRTLTANGPPAPRSDAGPLDELVIGALRRAQREGWGAERYRPLLQGRPVRDTGLWRVDFRDVSLRISNNKVVTDPRLAQVNNARARGFDELLIGSAFKTDAEYVEGPFQWKSGVEMEYTRSRVRPPNQPPVLNTQNNMLNARTLAARQAGTFPFGWVATAYGPSIGLEYEGEVERLPQTRRKNKLSLLPGVELFNGRFLRGVELSGTIQRDFTPPTPVPQYGARLHALMSAPFGRGQVSGELTTRYYVLTPHDTPQDLRLELNAVVRVNVPLFKRLNIAPYFDFFYFKHKVTRADGYSAMTGVSFAFSRLWKPGYEAF